MVALSGFDLKISAILAHFEELAVVSVVEKLVIVVMSGQTCFCDH